MEIRHAEPRDRPALRDVARRSFQASYSLGSREITTAVDELYDDETLGERTADERYALLVATRDGQVVGFAVSRRSDGGTTATLLWLHVDPDHRGEGTATELFEETERRLAAEGVDHLDGRALEDNADGNAFYEAMGYERVGQSEVEIAGRTHVETVWSQPDAAGPRPVDADGDTVFVNRDETSSGSRGDFFAVFNDRDLTERYGYYCGNCESPATAMDSMGRVECSCGNTLKPSRWDAAYM
jgi:ribosomal protein S18 acetylase RimI-like enzyme